MTCWPKYPVCFWCVLRHCCLSFIMLKFRRYPVCKCSGPSIKWCLTCRYLRVALCRMYLSQMQNVFANVQVHQSSGVSPADTVRVALCKMCFSQMQNVFFSNAKCICIKLQNVFANVQVHQSSGISPADTVRVALCQILAPPSAPSS